MAFTHDFSRCTALQAVERLWTLSPAHPRFTRMYGVTHSIAFQAILYIQNLNQLGKESHHLPKKHIFLSFFDNFLRKYLDIQKILLPLHRN